MSDLLSSLEPVRAVERLSEAAVVLRGFARDMAARLVAEVDGITAVAPFRNMMTPGGFRMSVGMTNCGRAGWV
ncbi:MAG: alpha-ketoglutarate-dependent dioxygenase AlkB, partial [Stellaceae bacterium]